MLNVSVWKICAIFVTVTCAAHSARILGIFHMAAYSHFQLGDRIFRELAARGHEVTVISPFELKSPVKNLKHIVLTGFVEKMQETQRQLYSMPDASYILKFFFFQQVTYQYAEDVLNHPNVQKLLKSNEKFDLVIYDLFANEAFHGFAHSYNVPNIVVSTIGVSQSTNSKMGNPHNPAYNRDFLLNYPKDMNLLQRTVNTLSYIFGETFMNLYMLSKQNSLLQKHFPGSPHVSELHHNTSLLFLNSHFSTQPPLHLLPNMIEIGGYHIPPSKPLPKDLQEYLDEAPDGVIYFSMGSNLKSADMPIEKRNEILKTFGKLKQQVLWKWEDEVLPGQPSNVKLAKWLPQLDILAHSNIKLFITHGGLLSTTEAIYFGVPILGLPVFGDQERNMKIAEEAGYGFGVLFRNINEDTLGTAINELLNNPTYTKTVKQKSKVMHDQPQKPLDTAIYWIEYVLRHQGAPHLRTAALNLKWYQLLLLDVILVIAAGVFAFLYIMCKVVKLICRKKGSAINKEKKRN